MTQNFAVCKITKRDSWLKIIGLEKIDLHFNWISNWAKFLFFQLLSFIFSNPNNVTCFFPERFGFEHFLGLHFQYNQFLNSSQPPPPMYHTCLYFLTTERVRFHRRRLILLFWLLSVTGCCCSFMVDIDKTSFSSLYSNGIVGDRDGWTADIAAVYFGWHPSSWSIA